MVFKALRDRKNNAFLDHTAVKTVLDRVNIFFIISRGLRTAATHFKTITTRMAENVFFFHSISFVPLCFLSFL